MKINYYHQTKNRFISKAKKIFVFAIIMVAAIWGFFWIPNFKVSNIEINNSLVRKSQVSTALASILNEQNNFYIPKSNFFLFSEQEAEKLILESDMGVVKIAKKFPNTLKLDFLEIKPKFIYCDKNCFYVDKNGLAYEIAPTFTESPVPFLEVNSRVKMGDYVISSKEALFLADFLKEIEKLGVKTEKIAIENDFNIFLKEGWRLILLKDESRSPEDIIQKLKLLLDQKIKNSPLDYIDMRFPNKAFYKLK